MRIHLGHHFYGAGNLGDDFMLAGFLAALRPLAPRASLTCCVPFALEPLRRRFPAVEWRPAELPIREQCIAACDVWLGLGGSPFQSALSRWFVDHLVADAAACARAGKPMFFLGVGVQSAAELNVPDIRRLCAQAAGIWTRDAASAEWLAALPAPPPMVEPAADLAHLFFRDTPPPPAAAGRLTLVANFDYGTWPGQTAFLHRARAHRATERLWLAQESRDLPGAERALHAALPAAEKTSWPLRSPELPGAPLDRVLAHWPSGEWLVTSRYHAALAGAWSRSKVIVIATNEKLRAAARELDCALLAPDADEAAVDRALASAAPATPGALPAERAEAACAAFVRAAS
ncbi:MAG: polysaccharide pyruvyl transferase family protein [Opitutus sp.]|nr:polysaccharide pyruvyl transferase family protein [Opitutus sp.]